MAEQTLTHIEVNRQRRSQLNRWYRWRKSNTTTRNRQRAANYSKGAAGAAHTYKRWTVVEEEIIMNSPLTDRDIGGQLGRTVGAIQNRRAKLQKGLL